MTIDIDGSGQKFNTVENVRVAIRHPDKAQDWAGTGRYGAPPGGCFHSSTSHSQCLAASEVRSECSQTAGLKLLGMKLKSVGRHNPQLTA
jgi:hypothetical protein